jgi:transposase InsO family protein
MNTGRCILVCLLLCLLLYSGSIVSRQTPVGEHLAAARDEQPGRVPDAIVLRILAKGLLVEELASGRLTLLDAAALFRELDGMPPRTVYATSPDPPIRLECPTEDERYCVRVISFARGALRFTQPARVETVTDRLVAEFEAERRRSGTIRLPDPGSLETVHGLLQRCARAGVSPPTTAPGDP